MPHIHAATCEVKKEGILSKFSSCKAKPVGLCIYCGRAFCPDHGDISGGHEKEVCSRKFCIAKREDLVSHLQYVAVVNQQNATGSCGISNCSRKPDGQCGRCKAYFCIPHLDTREETVGTGMQQMRQMATMCDHCWDRRPIWSKL